MSERPFLPLSDAWRRSRERRFAGFVRGLRLRERTDAALLGVAALLAAAVGAAAYGGMEAARSLGWLDPPVAAPVRDERMLDNLRRDLPRDRLLAAAYHPGENVLTVSQSGGAVHRLDVATGLWSRETPGDDVPSLLGDLVQVRAGCGGSPAAQESCADPEPLWGLGQHGALVRRLDGRWRAFIGDTTFVGRDGTPVENGDLTAAALSDDGTWLFLGTKEQGGGLYNLKERHWVTLGPANDGLPAGRIERAVWWKGRFAVGGPQGVALLKPHGKKPEAAGLPGMGAAADLVADDRGRLLVLEKRACVSGGEGCLRVSALKAPGADPELLMDERNRYPELDAAHLFFADLQGANLVVAGQKGVFAYDPAMRNWTRLDDRPVRTAVRERDTILYGYNGGAAAVSGGKPGRRWELAGEQVVQIIGLGREPAALTADGDVYSLPAQGDPKTLFQRGGTAADPRRFTEGFAAGDRVLLTGAGAATLHDVRRRTYTDVDPAALPPWLTDGRTRKVVSGSRVYGLVSQGRVATAASLDMSSLGGAGGPSGPAAIGSTPAVPGPVRQMRPWTGGGVAVIDGNGSLHRLEVGKGDALTGPPQPALDRIRLRDVADVGGGTVIAASGGIRLYDHAKREWSGWGAGGLDGGDIAGIAVGADDLFLHTGKERLGRLDGRVLIGQERVTVKAAELTDALMDADQLFLAGQGVVEQYSLSARSVVRRWKPPGGGGVRIVDVLGHEPLTLSDGHLALGDTLLGGTGGRVLSVSTDAARIVTVREQNGARYIRTHAVPAPRDDAQDQCLFRTPAAGGQARRLTDARALGDGWLLAATDDGLRLYSEAARSWYMVRGPSKGPIRLHRAGDHVVLSAGQNPALVQFIPVSAITRPASCSTAAVTLPDQWTEVRSISIDETAGTAVWLAPDGAVVSWQAGMALPVLAPATLAPRTDAMLRVFSIGGPDDRRLAFAMADGLALYRLADQGWTRAALQAEGIPLRGVSDVTLEPDGAGHMVTARLPDGRVFAGSWNGAATTVAMTGIPPLSVPPFVQSGNAVADVVSDGPYWMFLLDDRLKRFDPKARRFAPDILFPAAGTPRTLVRRGGRLVVEEDGGRVWWVARDSLPDSGADPLDAAALFDRIVPDPDEPTLIADDGQVVRVGRDGAVQACRGSGSCRTLVPAAPPLDPSSVTAAYEIGNLLFLETSAGRLLYDHEQRRLLPLPPDLSALGATADVVLDRTRLVLRDGQGMVLAVSGSGTVPVKQAGVTGLIRDRHRRLWLEGPLMLMESGGLQPVGSAFRLGKEIAPQAVTLLPGEVPALLGSDRRPRALDASVVEVGAPLAPEIDTAAVEAVHPTGRADVWWIQAAGSLTRVTGGRCSAPQPAPAPSKVPPKAPPKTAGGPDCLVADVTLPVPPGNPVAGVDDALPSRLVVRLANGDTLETRMSGTGLEPAGAGRSMAPALLEPAADVWPQWRSRIAPRPDGVPAIAPVQGFEPAGDRIGLKAADGSVPLGPMVRQQPEALGPLDAGWLTWDRQGRAFVIQGRQGPHTLAPGAFIRDGRFIFAEPGLAVATAGGRLQAANRAGLWTFPMPGGDLTDPGITFTPRDLPPAVAAAHGRFLFASGSVPYDGGQVEPDDDRHTVSIGDAVWTEALRHPSVTAAITVAGRVMDAGGAGFAWDRRQAVALADGVIQVQTAAGILQAGRLDGADPGPGGRLPMPGTIAGRDGGDLLLTDGAGWHRRSGGRWQADTVDAAVTRDLPVGQGWQWRVTPQGVVVDGVPPAGGATVGFLDDQVRAAATDGAALIVADAAGLALGPVDAVARRGARRVGLDTDVDSLLAVRSRPDQRDIVASGRDGVLRWVPADERFAALAGGANPFLDRDLVQHPRLRMALREGRGRVEIRLDSPSGESGWAPVSLDGGFPFDRVTGVHVLNGRLFIGTAAGLEEHVESAGTGFDSIVRLIDMRAGRAAAPAPVLRMGEPVSKPDVLAVRSPSRCITFDGTAYADCASPDLADVMRRAANRWWQWQRDAAGTVRGDYLDHSGGPLGVQVTIQGGFFNHDRIVDMAVCHGRAALLWDGGAVSVSVTPTVDPDRGMRTSMLPSRNARLSCLERDVREPGTDAPSGLYWITEQETRRFDGSSWLPVAGSGEKAAVRLRMDDGMPLDRERLRLVRGGQGGPVRFQQRRNDGVWEDLAWKDNRIGLDTFERLTVGNGRVWAATAAGIALLEQGGDGTLQVNPDRLVIVREPAGNCRVTDLETDGGGETWLRCNAGSNGVHRGRLDPGTDQGVFRPEKADPFAERDLVPATADGPWGWRLVGHVDGRPGQVAVTFRNEPARLDGGRFDFDSVSQIRSFVPGTLEVLTDNAGWFRSSGGGLGLASMARPANDRIDRRGVRRIAVARDEDGGRRLCLSGGQGQGVLLDGELVAVARTGACRDDRGGDGVWRYEQDAAAVRIHALDRRQRSGVRELKAGRFTDETAIGLPVSRRTADGAAEYLVPTLAGVVAFDAGAGPAGLYLPAFPDVPRDTAPAVLASEDGGRIVYLGDGNLVGLEDADMRPLPVRQLVPAGAKPVALEAGTGGLLRLGWETASSAGWTLFDPRAPVGALVMSEPVDTSPWREYARLRAQAGNAGPNLLAALSGPVLQVSSGFGSAPHAMSPDVGEHRAMIRAGQRLFVVGDRDVWVIDLPGALRATLPAGPGRL